MRLLEYLEPMKTLPNRFSNLAFWRILRVFTDYVVDAFTYVNTWGLWVEDVEVKQNDRLNSNENAISNIQTEQTTQNNRISSLEAGEGRGSERITTLEESVKTLNVALESVEKEQSTQNTDIESLKTDVSDISGTIETEEMEISTIKSEQTTQNDSIAANTSEISDIWKSIGFMNTDIDALKKLTYDASFNFKITTYNDTKATVTKLVDSLYIITPDANGYVFPSVPFHVVGRAFISIFTDESHTKTSTIAIPMTHVITMSNGQTKYIGSATPFYAPYGVNNMSGCYISYISHT